MEDYDWMLVNSGDWTHYSLSDVNLTEGYLLDVNVAWDLLDNWNNMTARVMAGYKQNGWTWEDEVSSCCIRNMGMCRRIWAART